MSSVLTKEYSFVRSLSQRIFGYWVLILVSPQVNRNFRYREAVPDWIMCVSVCSVY